MKLIVCRSKATLGRCCCFLIFSSFLLTPQVAFETGILRATTGHNSRVASKLFSRGLLAGDTHKASSESNPPARTSSTIYSCDIQFGKDNFAKIKPKKHSGCLDQVAEKVKALTLFKIVIDGQRDASERVGISLTRANNIRDHLVIQKGIERDKIEVRNFGDSCSQGKKDLNRRVQIWVLLEGRKVSDLEAPGLKKCAPGSIPRVITNENPAKSADPSSI